MKFLRSIISVCRSAKNCDLWCGLDAFCKKYQLAEHIKVLLEEEPLDVLHTAVQQQAMLALGHLSYVNSVLEGKKKSILLACFSSVFLLPSHEHLECESRIYYLRVCSGRALGAPIPLG
ncbi:maestro heat-like repeat family member 5 [Anas acuta]|uniref:maestro heat-like repeat family member 5 n=1 Tax=Anas acuta TaxID=28680 RepID=UPI0035C8B3AD